MIDASAGLCNPVDHELKRFTGKYIRSCMTYTCMTFQNEWRNVCVHGVGNMMGVAALAAANSFIALHEWQQVHPATDA